MIINNEIILSKFKTENYRKLTIEERKELVIEFINAIIKERGLTSVDIEFSTDLFAYNHIKNKVYISENALENNLPNPNYILLTGIIHEMRHKEQNGDDLFYTGRSYHLSPKELDAHKFTSSELVKLSNFMNDVEFDKYVYILMNNDALDINRAINYFLLCGYSKEEIPLICQQQAFYNRDFSTEPEDQVQKYFFTNNRLNSFENLSFDDLKKCYGCPFVNKYPQKGITEVTINNLNLFIKDDQIYVYNMRNFDDLSGDVFLKELQNAIIFIDQNYEELGVEKINSINFAPLSLIAEKEKKEQLYDIMKLENNSISLDDFLDFDCENDKAKSIIIKNMNGLEPVRYLKEVFGIDYLTKYSKEQQVFLESLISYIEDYETERLFNSGNNISFFAIENYRPEFSIKKLELIFLAQKEGLNTMYYNSLSEDQIKIMMNEQRKGIGRERIRELLTIFGNSQKTIEELTEESIGDNLF